MGVVDEALLRYIQTSLGYGNLHVVKKEVKGKGTLKLMISRGADFDHLAANVGGHIHHQGRRAQLAAVLQERGQPLPPRKLRWLKSGYFAGFWDADGTIILSQDAKTGRVKLAVSVTNNREKDLEALQRRFGGPKPLKLTLRDRVTGEALSTYYRWSLQSRDGVMAVVDYALETGAFRSHKSQRLAMVTPLIDLWNRGAHKPDHPDHHLWQEQRRTWNATHPDSRRMVADGVVEKENAQLESTPKPKWANRGVKKPPARLGVGGPYNKRRIPPMNFTTLLPQCQTPHATNRC